MEFNEIVAKQFVATAYSQLLGREADEAGKAFWINKMLSGDMSAAEVLTAFLRSNEFVAQDNDDQAAALIDFTNANDSQFANLVFDEVTASGAFDGGFGGGKTLFDADNDSGSVVFPGPSAVAISDGGVVAGPQDMHAGMSGEGFIFITPSNFGEEGDGYINLQNGAPNTFYIGVNPDRDYDGKMLVRLDDGLDDVAVVTEGEIFPINIDKGASINFGGVQIDFVTDVIDFGDGVA